MSFLFEQKKKEHHNLPDLIKRGVFTLQKVIADYGKVCNFARTRTWGLQPKFNHANVRDLEYIFKEILVLSNQRQGTAKQRRYRKRKLSTLKYSTTGVIGMEPLKVVPNKVQTLLKGLNPDSDNHIISKGNDSLGDNMILVKQPVLDLNIQIKKLSCTTTEIFHDQKDPSVNYLTEKIFIDHPEIKPLEFINSPYNYKDDLINRLNYLDSLKDIDYGDNPNDPNNQVQGVDILSLLPSFINESAKDSNVTGPSKKKKKKKRKKQPPRKPFISHERVKDFQMNLEDLSDSSEIEPSQSRVLPPELYYLRSWNTPSVFQGRSYFKDRLTIVFSNKEELDNYIKYLVPAVSFIADYKSDLMSDIVFGFNHKLIKSYKDCGLSELSILTMTVHTRFVEEILIPLHKMANVRH